MAVDAVGPWIHAALLVRPALHPREGGFGGEPDDRQDDVADGDQSEHCEHERGVVAEALLEQRRGGRPQRSPAEEDAMRADPRTTALLDRRTAARIAIEDADAAVDRGARGMDE